jgi:FixJ family two-component response regulator
VPPDALDTSQLVYVIDDDPSVRKALTRLFRSIDLRVETFESAESFLAHEATAAPCCAILDIRMPTMDGLTLQERLKRAGRTVPIVFITGDGDVPSSVRAMKGGALDILEKPFSEEELVRAVRAALETSQRRIDEGKERAALEGRARSLTPREIEVLKLVVQGMPNKVIGARLGTTEKTIKVHRGRAMEKMGARSLPELVRIAQSLGLSA